MAAFRKHDLLHCSNCEFAFQRHGDPELLAKAEAAGHPVPPLQCLRNPEPVPKRPEDCCADHSELIARRNMELADMIAIAIVRQSRVKPASDNGG